MSDRPPGGWRLNRGHPPTGRRTEGWRSSDAGTQHCTPAHKHGQREVDTFVHLFKNIFKHGVHALAGPAQLRSIPAAGTR